ncbi:hypothetical protein FJ366_04350 [Candidatus Dependentiae bacterium]|nr:hypothetical protein [Candidatus Dependentiae bacterium]
MYLQTLLVVSLALLSNHLVSNDFLEQRKRETMRAIADEETDPRARRVYQQRAELLERDAAQGKLTPPQKTSLTRAPESSSSKPISHAIVFTPQTQPKQKTSAWTQTKRLARAGLNKLGFKPKTK